MILAFFKLRANLPLPADPCRGGLVYLVHSVPSFGPLQVGPTNFHWPAGEG